MIGNRIASLNWSFLSNPNVFEFGISSNIVTLPFVGFVVLAVNVNPGATLSILFIVMLVEE